MRDHKQPLLLLPVKLFLYSYRESTLGITVTLVQPTLQPVRLGPTGSHCESDKYKRQTNLLWEEGCVDF